MANQQPKKRKPGRPRLPKGAAKNATLPAVRFKAAEMKEIEAAAKAQGLTVSEWIRQSVTDTLAGGHRIRAAV